MLPPQDVGEPEAFLAAAAVLFAQYAPEIGDKAAFEIPQRSDRPTLKLMREVLDELNERAIERRNLEQSRRLLPHQPAARTPEQQARAEHQIQEIRRAHGIPPQGLERISNPTNPAKTA